MAVRFWCAGWVTPSATFSDQQNALFSAYLVAGFVAHVILEGHHGILYRKVAVGFEQSFVSLTVPQEQEHALGQFVCVCNTIPQATLPLYSVCTIVHLDSRRIPYLPSNSLIRKENSSARRKTSLNRVQFFSIQHKTRPINNHLHNYTTCFGPC